MRRPQGEGSWIPTIAHVPNPRPRILPRINDVVTTGVAEYYPAQWYAGAADGGAYAATGIFLPNTGLAVSADGNDGGNFAANALNVYVLYRN